MIYGEETQRKIGTGSGSWMVKGPDQRPLLVRVN